MTNSARIAKARLQIALGYNSEAIAKKMVKTTSLPYRILKLKQARLLRRIGV